MVKYIFLVLILVIEIDRKLNFLLNKFNSQILSFIVSLRLVMYYFRFSVKTAEADI